MIHLGLTSVTFRKADPQQVIQLVHDAGLQSIEWGGDVHVPSGNIINAQTIGKMTQDAGLKIAGYGSYFAAGDQSPEAFKPVLQAAIALGAPIIRVWAGWQASQAADPAYVNRVITCTQNICDMAADYNILVGYEYHTGTLTDNAIYATQILQRIGKENMRLYWQPNPHLSLNENCAALRTVLPYLHNVHLFHLDENSKRLPLKCGARECRAYVQILKESAQAKNVMLEFVQNDTEEQYIEDACYLRELFG